MEQIGGIQIRFKHGVSSKNHANYPGFKQESRVLAKGTVLKEGAFPLPCDILWERDIPVKLRDGTTIYIDIFRRSGLAASVPAIISSGGFGKNGGVNRMILDKSPWRNGIPQQTVSSLEKFEALDPAYWCLHGYALIHPDIRGSWMSEGDSYINSTIDGKDGYDLVEWVAQQLWSNKNVTMAGNSYLAQTQWFVAAAKPPHLTCIAPWEGWNDLYNDTAQRGGIPNPEFQQGLLDNCLPGLGRTEDIAAMTYQYPLWNEYWEDRRARCDQIDIPMYVVASWTNALHTRGTFRGWIESPSNKKWLRVHDSHEWPDLYYGQNVEDLRKFFDHFMKGTSNGWEFTPRVRLSVLNPGHQNIINRPEVNFPLARQISHQLYLDGATCSMQTTPPKHKALVEFDSVQGQAQFSYTFPQMTELTGYFKLKLFVQAVGNDDLDIFVKFRKTDKNGIPLETRCIDASYLQDDPIGVKIQLEELRRRGDKKVDVYFSEGSTGRLRVSHRELDAMRSTPHQPHYTHLHPQPLKEGEVVPVEIEMWPHGMIWEAGEQIQLIIAGHNLRPEIAWLTPTVKTCNKGTMVIHTGPEFNSYLLVPLVPSES
ncbi:hydrolase CocE/NonD family protein [Talaromyces proteolyticus]|uniref:Hydrolase CocE/NonD family protein n=1 Tax=Talaromyces proteolyticus TaxID=1131652 RepID=A0AAD4KGL8_9EURO|nr:hydrolase CocE/NonD family protein [Talaromyces proteolyticus]KAH8691270.1 hydrolase CocE/NonD family protein [Talaromyces proteolyticus]